LSGSQSAHKSHPNSEKSKMKIIRPGDFNHIHKPIDYNELFLKKNLLIVWLVNLSLVFLFSLLTIFAEAQPTPAGTNPNGYNVFYYDNGLISSEGKMQNGFPVGLWKNYYENGALKSEGKRNEKGTDSTWIFYRPDGSLEKMVDYHSGVKEGKELIFGKVDNLLEEYNYQTNKKEGKAKFYYESGELYRELEYINGKEEGKGYEFAKDGRTITVLSYKDGFLRSIERVNRQDDLGKRTGVWWDLHDNGRIRMEGNWTEGERNGLFKVFDRKGEFERFERYTNGELLSDDDITFLPDIRKEFHESGELSAIGTYRDGSKQGVFREYDKEGTIISSALYENNIKVGEGLVDARGLYQGDWLLFHPTGELRAKGSYVDGKKEGKWEYFYKTGKTEQIGNYRNDLPDGPWKWYYEKGASWREETFRRGKEDGTVTEWDETGKVILQGEYEDGNRVGPWLIAVGEYVERGNYADGEKHGKWEGDYATGKPAFVGEFKNGIPVGKHRYFFDNGQLLTEGKHRGGERHGDWKHFTEEGVLYYTLTYKDGEVFKIDGLRTERNP
jgi:uncharacterized protein